MTFLLEPVMFEVCDTLAGPVQPLYRGPQFAGHKTSADMVSQKSIGPVVWHFSLLANRIC